MNVRLADLPVASLGDWLISPRVGEIKRVAEFTVVGEVPLDVAAREALLDRVMGPARKRKASETLRRGRKPAEGLAFVAKDGGGRVVGTVRLWDVEFARVFSPLAGEMAAQQPEGVTSEGSASRLSAAEVTQPRSASPIDPPRKGEGGVALLLGPLCVDTSVKSAGIGSALMRHAIAEAKRLGHGAIVLVGDAAYYRRFGFSAEKTAAMSMPGPYEQARLLALELVPGGLDGAAGTLRATGRKMDERRAPGRRAA